MKFQEIILNENKKLARQVLILNQSLYEERNEKLKAISLQRLQSRDSKCLESNNTLVMELKRRCEKE